MALERTQPDFKSQLSEYLTQDNTLPKLISLIWIGNEIPNSKERPYLDNAIRHKRLHPKFKVQIFVHEALLRKDPAKWNNLVEVCVQEKLILRDIATTCVGYLNYDLILKLMQNKIDYVWASDLLRLSLMYHEGGEYFDTDLRPILNDEKKFESKSTDERNPPFGFYIYFDVDERNSPKFEFCYLASVPAHFFFREAAAISRYLYECMQNEIARNNHRNPAWLESTYAVVRQLVICNLSGASHHILIMRSSLYELLSANNFILLLQWPQQSRYKISHDHTWLEGLKLPEAQSNNSESSLRAALLTEDLYDAFLKFYHQACSVLDEAFMHRQSERYFNKQLNDSSFDLSSLSENLPLLYPSLRRANSFSLFAKSEQNEEKISKPSLRRTRSNTI